MSTPTNHAAYLDKPETAFVVREAPYVHPGPGEIVVKNGAVALNPMDWMIQAIGTKLPFPKSYPAIIGADVAGTVHEVGEGVAGFKPGDRVTGKANWFRTALGQHGGFQGYTTTEAAILAKLPDDVSFKEGCVLPLAICTSAMGLYPAKRLGLPLPQAGKKPKKLGKVILIWGGASSTGSAAIQLAVASGVTVVTTASKKNWDFVKGLGASAICDYKDEDVIEQLVEAIKKTGDEYAGALDAIARDQVWRACAKVARVFGGGKVATNWPTPDTSEGAEGIELLPVNDVSALSVNSDYQGICEHVWKYWLPQALELGTLKPVPKPLVIGKGLDKVQEACERGRKGVSAAKLVIEL